MACTAVIRASMEPVTNGTACLDPWAHPPPGRASVHDSRGTWPGLVLGTCRGGSWDQPAAHSWATQFMPQEQPSPTG